MYSPQRPQSKQTTQNDFYTSYPSPRTKQYYELQAKYDDAMNIEKLAEARKYRQEQFEKLKQMIGRLNHIQSQEFQTKKKFQIIGQQCQNVKEIKMRISEERKEKDIIKESEQFQLQVKNKDIKQRKLISSQKKYQRRIQTSSQNRFSLQKTDRHTLHQDQLQMISIHQERLKQMTQQVKQQHSDGEQKKMDFFLDKSQRTQKFFQRQANEIRLHAQQCQEKVNLLEQQETDLLLSLQKSEYLYKSTLEEMKDAAQNSPVKLIEQLSHSSSAKVLISSQPSNRSYQQKQFTMAFNKLKFN